MPLRITHYALRITHYMESHPFEPWMPPDARLLMCGTFPPPASRWTMEFYYPNFINDMWRIFGLILAGDKDRFVDIPGETFHLDDIKQMLTRLGIALSDTGREVIRQKGNASDKFLDIVTPINLSEMLSRMPKCIAVATTGQKAAEQIAEITGTAVPKTGESVVLPVGSIAGIDREIRHYRMPSSSRAYPLKLPLKARAYENMLRELKMIE